MSLPIRGKTYRVRDSRKGTFVGRCLRVDGEWADFKILSGTAKYLTAPDAGPGSTVSCRHTLCEYGEENA